MQIVIRIQDIWTRYAEDSLALKNVGVTVEEVVHLAFGYAVLTCQTRPVSLGHRAGGDIFTLVTNLLADRLPIDDRLPGLRQSVYGGHSAIVYKVVDMVGEISHMLADAVIQQLGTFPPYLRLLRFVGPDLVLILNEEHRESLSYRIA